MENMWSSEKKLRSNKKLNKQFALIEESINSGTPLEKILTLEGMTYDDLIYTNNDKPILKNNKYYTIEEFENKKNSIPIVSFFSGAGGIDLGFEASGFYHSLLIEINPLFCETVKINRPNWDIVSADISQIEQITNTVSSRVGTKKTFEGIFIGGPPCQPFSIAANQRFNKSGSNFKRIGFAHQKNGNLLFDYIALIKHFKPSVFLIENVPGLIDVDNGEQLRKAYHELSSCGYSIEKPLILSADFYHVPQQRVRIFIIGNRMKKSFKISPPCSNALPVGQVFELPIENSQNHITRKHSAQSILRYMMLDYGRREKLGRVDRLDPLLPSKTVIAGGSSGGGRSHLHPYIPRTLSVRECARIQTFPDNYIFNGSVARQFTQVGNAVPPVLGAQLANDIYNSFYK